MVPGLASPVQRPVQMASAIAPVPTKPTLAICGAGSAGNPRCWLMLRRDPRGPGPAERVRSASWHHAGGRGGSEGESRSIGKLASLLAVTVTPQKDINVRPPVGESCGDAPPL